MGFIRSFVVGWRLSFDWLGVRHSHLFCILTSFVRIFSGDQSEGSFVSSHLSCELPNFHYYFRAVTKCRDVFRVQKQCNGDSNLQPPVSIFRDLTMLDMNSGVESVK